MGSGFDEDMIRLDMIIRVKVSLFLYPSFIDFKNIFLSNEIIVISNHGEDDKILLERLICEQGQQGHPWLGCPTHVEFESVSNLGATHTKIIAQITYGLRLDVLHIHQKLKR